MNILFLGGDTGDYLNISLLHGLKNLPDVVVYDYPKSEVSYKQYINQVQPYLRGKGFTLFFNLEDQPINRFHLLIDEVRSDFFDLIIFGDIQFSFGYYVQLLPYLKPKKVIFLDGSDSPALFGYSGIFWRNHAYWFIPKPHKKYLYFKREFTPETIFSRYYRMVPQAFLRYLPGMKNIRPISFSFPQEKIVFEMPVKTKLFSKHIVDEEVASNVPGSFTQYAFETEAEYYEDLQQSKFGITTKRAGWDCLRHYEIAANGAVICFKDLDKKPKTCAPHGLVANVNCISYVSFKDLIKKIELITEEQYQNLQKSSFEWIHSRTTISLAKDLLSNC